MAKIRPFTPQDQSATRQLILEGLGGHFGFIDETMNPDLGDIQQNYVLSGGLFVVAELDGVVVGTGALIDDEGNGRLVRMSVRNTHQRQGIGRKLVHHLIQKAKEQEYDRLLVQTNNDWVDAIGLYQSCGFREYDRDEEIVYMKLALNQSANG